MRTLDTTKSDRAIEDQVEIKSSLVGRLALDYMYTPRHNQTSNVLVLDRASPTRNHDLIGG